ncbi:MAG: DUF2849 domain-containing protein [Alphaproteobacteria bacterium]
MPQIITANRLADGAVVYLDGQDRWVERIADACPAADDETLARLTAQAEAAVRARLVVDAYPIEVSAGEAGIRPARLRERIRSLGPTVRTDLGHQARVE